MSTKSSNSNTLSSLSFHTDHCLVHELRLAQQDLHAAINDARCALMLLRHVLEYKESLISIIPNQPDPLIPAPLVPATLLRLSADTLHTLQTTDPTASRHVTKESILEAIGDLLDDVDVLTVVADKERGGREGEQVWRAWEGCVDSAVEYARLLNRGANAEGGAFMHRPLSTSGRGDVSKPAVGEEPEEGGAGLRESNTPDENVIPGSDRLQARMRGEDLEVTEGGDDEKVVTDVEETFWDQQ